MLQSLHVHNFALLEDAHADFTAGFNVFTGETGAGKSILIDAFGIVLGGRASADYVRSGTEGLWVQAVFDVSGQQEIKDILQEQGLECDEELFLKRQISAAGKSRAYVNGVQVPLNTLRQLGAKLVDIHGQHENQALLKADTPRVLTDMFGGEPLARAKEEYTKLYAEYVQAQRALEQLKVNSEQQDILLDRYEWEINEIENSHLQPGEEEGLEEEARILQHSEKIIKAVDAAYSLLDAENSVLSRLARVREQLQYAARYDSGLQGQFECADSAWISLEDCRTELSDYLSRSDFNDKHAAEVQERLDLIYRLQKKYGGTTEDVLAYLAEAKAKQSELLDIAEAMSRAQHQLDVILQRLAVTAAALSKERRASARELGEAVTAHIHDLAMPNGAFEVTVTELEHYTPSGKDGLSFRFSANMGEPLNALERVASGGELSRIALAMKTVLLGRTKPSIMVFDEIDTGVGGVTAQMMAEKIAAISAVGQVLCITHLPQIAAFADNHIHIEKQSLEGRTATSLTVLDEDERIHELMRMTAGKSASRAAYDNARELLENAAKVKLTLK